MVLDFHNRTLRISTFDYHPFSVITKHPDGRVEFSGVCAKIIDTMAKTFNFHPAWHATKDGYFGAYDNTTQRWNGMIGEVQRGEADIAASGISVTSQRDQVIDYLHPYREESLSVLVREVSGSDTLLSAALQPFSLPLWLGILGAGLLVAGALGLTASLTPCQDPLRASLSRALWYTFTSALNQGQVLQARATSVRCVVGAWLFCCVVLSATYSATLTASLTVSHKKMPFSTLQEMVAQTEYKYGVYRHGLTGFIFKSATDGIYKAVYDGMAQDETNFMDYPYMGVAKARKEKFAYIGDVSNLERQTIHECSMRLIDERFYKTGFAFAVAENWPYKEEFNLLILRLLEYGFVDRWMREEAQQSACDNAHAIISAQQMPLSGVRSNFHPHEIFTPG